MTSGKTGLHLTSIDQNISLMAQNEISTKAGLESGACIKYLKVLLDLGIVKKETPVTEKQGEVVLLTLEDIYGKRQHTEK